MKELDLYVTANTTDRFRAIARRKKAFALKSNPKADRSFEFARQMLLISFLFIDAASLFYWLSHVSAS